MRPFPFCSTGSQYSDYMVLDYSCLQGPSLSVCDHASISTSSITDNDQSSVSAHRLFLRSPNYPNEYENSLNCSCQVMGKKSNWKFLDFYLEERDEMDVCSRDRLQIANRSYCGSTLDDQKQTSSLITINSSTQLTFKSNDVITRKGFWLMITSEHPVQVSCSNLMESTTTIVSSSVVTTRIRAYSTLSTTTASTLAVDSLLSSNDNPTQHKRRHALSYVLLLTIVFVVVLLLLNFILIILCWRQRRKKEKIDVKSNGTNRPFFCSARSTSSSSSCVTYGETPVLTALDAQKQSSTSSRYIFQPTQHHLDTTPSTSTTTATTGPYEDLQDSSTLQRPLSKQKPSNDHLLYMQQRHIPSVSLASPQTGYNRMIHFPPAPIRCHFSTPAQTFYPAQPCFDSQHIYETIQDGQCPYQRLAATLRRPAAAPACSCYYERNEQGHPLRNAQPENSNMGVNPETLVWADLLQVFVCHTIF